MNAMTSVPPEIADSIIAVIIYFTATSVLFQRFWDRITRYRRSRHPEQSEEE